MVTGKDFTIEMFTRRKINENFRLDPHDDNVINIRNRTSASPTGGILFTPIGERGGYLKPQIVLKPVTGRLEYNESQVARDAVGQFKTLLEEAVESVEERKRERENNEGILVETNTEYIDSEFPGLTDEEKREIGGVLNPPERHSAVSCLRHS